MHPAGDRLRRGAGEIAPAPPAGVVDERAFRVTTALLFVASAAGTILWCRSMSGSMRMPGGWSMSMAWMRMPEQSWFGATAMFLGMWIVMMLAMMLPSLVPMLSSYRRALRAADAPRLGGLTTIASVGYFAAWTLLGVVAYPLGLGLATAEMRWSPLSRCVPIATGVVLILAGSIQLTGWKFRHLECCRNEMPTCEPTPADARQAWLHGLRLGAHCMLCCTGYMLALFVVGVMDLRAMAVVAAAITLERLAPRPRVTARATGIGIVVAGTLAIARASHLV